MKLVITGASGFIGRQIIPHLQNLGHSLLLAGRNLDKMRALFPDQNICSYENLTTLAVEYDAILHLAVINNNSLAEPKIFNDVNVGFVQKVAQDAKSADITHFINLSSTHSKNNQKKDSYSISKREGEVALEAVGLRYVSNYYIPAVYGHMYQGKLSFLNNIPAFIRPLVLNCVAALKPTLSIQKLAAEIDKKIRERKLDDKSRSADFENIYLSDTQVKNGIFLLQKRLTDFLASVVIILLLSWAFILISILIALTSRGPIIFAQRRVGKERKPFTCYKFRTMSVDTPNQPTHLTSSAHLTNLGKFLRKTKLDELPQLYNILRNDMSLVGPRPCLPSQKELIDARALRSVFSIKPGITGLAQTKAIDMSDPKKLAIEDAKYVAMQTAPGDMMLIIRTLLGSGQGDRTGVK